MEWVGYLAGICTTLSIIPQLLHTYRHKSVGDLALTMYLIGFLGTLLWLVYGIIMMLKAIILTNMVSMVLIGLIIFMKIHYEEK